MKILEDKLKRGFTLFELVAVVAVLGIIASIAYRSIGGIHDATREEKLRSDVNTLNRAVQIYAANGGDLTTAEDSQEVLERLKSARTSETASRYAGLTSSMTDVRVSANFQSDSEAETDQLRAEWDPDRLRFVLKRTGDRAINSFELDDDIAEKLDEMESRGSGAFMYAEKDEWIWDYEDRPKPSAPGATAVVVYAPNPTPKAPVPPSGPPNSNPNPNPNEPIALIPPVITPDQGVYPSSDFPLQITIEEHNPSGAAVIRYAIDEGSYQTYSSPFAIAGTATVRAYSGSADPRRFTPSENVESVYEEDRWSGNPANLFAYGMYSTVQLHLGSINQLNVTGGMRSETHKIKISGSDAVNISGNMEATKKIEFSDLSGVVNGDMISEESVRGDDLVTHNGSVYIDPIGSKQLYTLPAPTGPDDPNYAHPITIIEGDYTIDGPLALNGTVYVTRNIRVRGAQSITGSGALVAGGQIHISGVNTTIGQGADDLFLYSLGSQIHIADSDGLTVNGVCYAPNAQVHFSDVRDVTINGGIYSGGQIHLSDINSLTVKPGISSKGAIPPGIVAFVTDSPEP